MELSIYQEGGLLAAFRACLTSCDPRNDTLDSEKSKKNHQQIQNFHHKIQKFSVRTSHP